MKFKEIYPIVVSIIAVLSITAFVVLFFHGGYYNKVLAKLGLKEPERETNWATFSWDSCLEKLGYDADVAFFGDSITRGGNFQVSFPNKKIINLGLSGDTLTGITERVSMLKHTSPEKVFLMIGINGLKDNNRTECIKKYSTLLASIKEAVPEADVYIQSILPISKEKEKTVCSNSTIQQVNEDLKQLAEQNDMIYIDLFSAFAEQNEIKANLSKDGIHITSEGYEVWANIIEKYIE